MRAVLAALAANLGIAITKFIAFLVSGSTSMLAEAVHSVADTGNQVLLLVGRGRSGRPASEEHPFGFGRERYFYGFIVSVMLFTVGAVFSVYEGVHKITNPEEIRWPPSSCWPYRPCWRGSRCAPPSMRRTPYAATATGARSSGAPSRLSCRWSCWRTPPP